MNRKAQDTGRNRKVVVRNIETFIHRLEFMGKFQEPYEVVYADITKPFHNGAYYAEVCMAWTWYQWLMGARSVDIMETVSHVLSNCIQNFKLKADQYWRAEHDLMCGHLAAIAGDRDQLMEIAVHMTYAEEMKGRDVSKQAWSGFLKFSLLGDKVKARSQAEIMFAAPRPINLRLPRKPVVQAWLNDDWKAFENALKHSYKQLWSTFLNNGRIVQESDGSVQVTLMEAGYRTEGHWQENALAILAWERGVEVPTDPLWLPPAALSKR